MSYKMQRRIINITTITVILILMFIFLWPLSFSGFLSDESELLVTVTDVVIDGIGLRHETTNYSIQPGTETFEQIQQILNSYTYRRTWRTFLNHSNVQSDSIYYWLIMFSGDNILLTGGGTGEININGNIYRVGYWGNARVIEMMREIRAVLENNEGISIY